MGLKIFSETNLIDVFLIQIHVFFWKNDNSQKYSVLNLFDGRRKAKLILLELRMALLLFHEPKIIGRGKNGDLGWETLLFIRHGPSAIPHTYFSGPWTFVILKNFA